MQEQHPLEYRTPVHLVHSFYPVHVGISKPSSYVKEPALFQDVLEYPEEEWGLLHD